VNTRELANWCIDEVDDEFFGGIKMSQIEKQYRGFEIDLNLESSRNFLKEPLIFAAKRGYRMRVIGFFHLNVNLGISAVAPVILAEFKEDDDLKRTHRGHIAGKKFEF
jgi:hypothetical protein